VRHRHREPDPNGIVAIHASAVYDDHGALVFLGPTGAGKSTVCELLSAETRKLADDKVYLVPLEDGAWAVADASHRSYYGPLSEGEAALLETWPLQALFRLYQAPRIRLQPADALTTCRDLVNAFLELYWHRYLDVAAMRGAYRSLARVSRGVSAYRLHFANAPGVTDVVLRRARTVG
jgi:hypothetical protein